MTMIAIVSVIDMTKKKKPQERNQISFYSSTKSCDRYPLYQDVNWEYETEQEVNGDVKMRWLITYAEK